MLDFFEELKFQKSENKKNKAFFNKYGDRFKDLFMEKIDPKLRNFGFEGECPKYKLENENYIYFLEFDLKDREFKNLSAGIFVEQLGRKSNYISNEFLSNQNLNKQDIELDECIINFSNYRKGIHNMIEVENNENSFKKGIDKMEQIVEKHIFSFFNQYRGFPKPFSEISFQEYKAHKYSKLLAFPEFVWTGLLLAKININIGEIEKAKEIAQWAKGYRNSDLIKKQLDEIINYPQHGV